MNLFEPILRLWYRHRSKKHQEWVKRASPEDKMREWERRMLRGGPIAIKPMTDKEIAQATRTHPMARAIVDTLPPEMFGEKRNKMSYPTTLNPWYVVARESVLGGDADGMKYYTTIDEEPGQPAKFTPNKKEAMLFTHLGTAHRVAGSDPDCIIIVLCTKEHVEEFGR